VASSLFTEVISCDLCGDAVKTALAGIQSAINGFIGLDPDARVRLEPLAGSRLVLSVDGLFDVEVELGPAGIQLGPISELRKDARISGSPLALLRMVHEARSGGDVSGANVNIAGDVEFVQQLKRFMAALDIDWEEQLSKVMGDAGARGASVLVGSFAGWLRQVGRTVGMNAQEYLEEELAAVASSPEVTEFSASVDTLRDDVERLTAKISRLKRSANESQVC
jgi:ubiquinone biosynthesis protein UbiJ